MPRQNLVVLVPANVTLEAATITEAFIDTHLVTTNPDVMTQFVSVNGVRGVFGNGKDSLCVLHPPPEVCLHPAGEGVGGGGGRRSACGAESCLRVVSGSLAAGLVDDC